MRILYEFGNLSEPVYESKQYFVHDVVFWVYTTKHA